MEGYGTDVYLYLKVSLLKINHSFMYLLEIFKTAIYIFFYFLNLWSRIAQDLFQWWINFLNSIYFRVTWGTDTFVYISYNYFYIFSFIQVNSSEANECLPIYNTTTSRMYEAEKVVSDWSSSTTWNQSIRTYCTAVKSKQPMITDKSIISIQWYVWYIIICDDV